jgi:hypothetical protein
MFTKTFEREVNEFSLSRDVNDTSELESPATSVIYIIFNENKNKFSSHVAVSSASPDESLDSGFIETLRLFSHNYAFLHRRSRVRFPMESVEFFSDLILPVALWPWGRLSL